MNTKTVPNCPRCNAKGNVIDQRKKFVMVECPDCNYVWQTRSKICPKCEKPNGYVVEGVCGPCYSKFHKS